MKAIKWFYKSILALLAMLVMAFISAVSFYQGREYEAKYFGTDSQEYKNLKKTCQKNYEAACLQADFIRYIFDSYDNVECANTGLEIKKCYYEYFSNMKDFKTNIKHVREFDNYYWCY